MTPRFFKIFIAVAEEKTMHGAARRLYISQPSVSQAISDFEKEHGVKLFERLSQRLYITDAGKELLNYAYRIISLYDETEQMLQRKGKLSRLKIGASVSVGTCLIYDLLEKLKTSNPEIEISMVVNNTSHIENLIMESKIDVGVVEGVVNEKELICKKICEDELIIVASPSHHLLREKVCTVDALRNEIFIAREKGSNDRNQFEKFLHSQNIELHKGWESSNTETIKNAVIKGYGMAILSRMVVQKELDSGVLAQVPIKDVCIKRNIKFICHKDKFITKELSAFAKACEVDL